MTAKKAINHINHFTALFDKTIKADGEYREMFQFGLIQGLVIKNHISPKAEQKLLDHFLSNELKTKKFIDERDGKQEKVEPVADAESHV